MPHPSIALMLERAAMRVLLRSTHVLSCHLSGWVGSECPTERLGRMRFARDDRLMWPFVRKSPEEKLADRQEKDRIREERAAAQHAFEQLLDKAAAISSARVVCHRDTWSFTESCARTRNVFISPTSQEIIDLPDGMREIRVSGPNLVELLITTRNIGNKSWDAGERAVASRIYKAIAEIVTTVDTSIKGGATVPPIVIDAAPRRTTDDGKF